MEMKNLVDRIIFTYEIINSCFGKPIKYAKLKGELVVRYNKYLFLPNTYYSYCRASASGKKIKL